jgi:hypothetical protein
MLTPLHPRFTIKPRRTVWRISILLRLGFYRLDEQIAGQGAITYRGVVESSQKPVYIHLIPQDVTIEEKRRILSRLQRRLSLAAGSNGLLDVRHEGAQLYAITEVVSGFTGFTDWLNQETPEVMRAPATNTVDGLIASFDAPSPPPDPKALRRAAEQRERQRDFVAEIFAQPLAATGIRGQKPLADQGRESYSPPVEVGPGPYTMVVDPGKRPAPSTPTEQHQVPDASAAQQMRIAVLETQVAMFKVAAIAASAIAGLCLLITFVLLMRSK